MSAQVIQLNDHRAAARKVPLKPSRKRNRRYVFERGADGYGDFMRGRKYAEGPIKNADSAEIEGAFWAIVKEAMRRAEGGEHSRKPWEPTADGFLQSIARYVATGVILSA